MKINKLMQSNPNGKALKLIYWYKLKILGQHGSKIKQKIIFIVNRILKKSNLKKCRNNKITINFHYIKVKIAV